MADSLKTGMGAICREQHHISARREFSQYLTAGWGPNLCIYFKTKTKQKKNRDRSSHTKELAVHFHPSVPNSVSRVSVHAVRQYEDVQKRGRAGLELCTVPIKAKHHAHNTERFSFPPPVETSAGTDALPRSEVPSVGVSLEDDLNVSELCSKSA